MRCLQWHALQSVLSAWPASLRCRQRRTHIMHGLCAGTRPNPHRDCVSCTGQYSTIGQCQDCAAPNVADGNHQTCITCSPGTGPNDNWTDCRPCTSNPISTFGLPECGSGTVADRARVRCDDISQSDVSSDIHTCRCRGDDVGTNVSSNLLPSPAPVNVLGSFDCGILQQSNLATCLSQSLLLPLALRDQNTSQISTWWNQADADNWRNVDVIVTFAIVSSNVVAVLRNLDDQLKDPESPLLTSPMTSMIDTMSLTFSFVPTRNDADNGSNAVFSMLAARFEQRTVRMHTVWHR